MTHAYHLFDRIGVELEYMIVDRETLAVRPITDEVIRAVAGSYQSEIECEELAWSNELVLHVIELKTNGPATAAAPLGKAFQRDVRRINEILEPHNAMLMPSAMHPWMDPNTETRLWPHEHNPVYEAFDRIFGCRGHGWSNLQSTHINLPFSGDEEFGRLHAAIRLIMPLLPALAASSPVADGKVTGLIDTRLETYRHNAKRIPAVSAGVIPEPVFTTRDYHERILYPLYKDIAPHDPDGVLQEEWLNARGAIARFDRDTIEIRVLDIQECVAADLSIVELITRVLRALTWERWSDYAAQKNWPVEPLKQIFLATIRDGERTPIENTDLLRTFGITQATSAGEVWRHLFEDVIPPDERDAAEFAPIKTILNEGTLSRRILNALGDSTSHERIADVYRKLCTCLAEGAMFHA